MMNEKERMKEYVCLCYTTHTTPSAQPYISTSPNGSGMPTLRISIDMRRLCPLGLASSIPYMGIRKRKVVNHYPLCYYKNS